MAEVKWIKIVTDIFDDEKILLIDSLPEHDSIIVIWFKLLCLAGKQNNCGVLTLNNKIVYTDEMLSTIFRRPLNVVRLALATFQKYEMIEIVDDVISIPNWEKHQNFDKLNELREYNRIAKQKSRAKQKLLQDVNDLSLTSQKCQDTDIEVDVEIDIDKDKECIGKTVPTELPATPPSKKQSRFVLPTIEEIKAYCREMNYNINVERFFDYYTANGWMVGKNKMKDWKATVRNWARREGHNASGNSSFDVAEIEETAITRYKK